MQFLARKPHKILPWIKPVPKSPEPRGLTPGAGSVKLRVHAVGATRPAEVSRNGGIGRRAWFRSMYSQGCGGSSPLFGTKFRNKRASSVEVRVLFSAPNFREQVRENRDQIRG